MTPPSLGPRGLPRLLAECTTQVIIDGRFRGTAFFTAPGRAMTCAHVVAHAVKQPDRIVLRSRDTEFRVEHCLCEPLAEPIPDPYPFPDAALITLAGHDHPWVAWEDAEPAMYPEPDSLFSVGWTNAYDKSGPPRLTPAKLRYEGGLWDDDDAWRMQLRDGRITNGMSGAPVVNERTGRVCAMMTRTRDVRSDLGGWAVPLGHVVSAVRNATDEEGQKPDAVIADAAHEKWSALRQSELFARVGQFFKPAYRKLPALENVSPSILLRAEYGVVPFSGRQSEVNAFIEWCTSDSQAAVRLLHGPGGAGKTRFAAEICEAMTRRGWTAGFLSSESDPEILDLLRDRGDPILAVLDYGDSRTDIRTLLSRLSAPAEMAPPTRILILARQRNTWGRWAEEAAIHLPLDEVFLRPLAVTREQHRSAYTNAMGAFSRALGAPSSSPQENLPELDNQPILVVHMTALLSVQAKESVPIHTRGTDADRALRKSVVKRTLDRECYYWRRNAAAAKLDIDDELLRRVVSVATLFTAEDEMQTVNLMRTIPDLANASSERLHAIARWVLTLFETSNSQRTAILQPDLLLEQLVADTFTDCPAMLAAFEVLPPPLAEWAWLVIGRACVDNAPLLRMLERAAGARPAHMIRMLIPTAERSEAPLREVLFSGVEAVDADPETLHSLAAAIPTRSVLLQDAAIKLMKRAIQISRTRDSLTYSWLLIQLSTRLRSIGRKKEAATVSAEFLKFTHSELMAHGRTPTVDLVRQLAAGAKQLKIGGQEADALVAAQQAKSILSQIKPDQSNEILPLEANILQLLTELYTSLGKGKDARNSATEEWRLLSKFPETDDIAARAALARRLQGRARTLIRHVDPDDVARTLSAAHQARIDAVALADDPDAEWIETHSARSTMLSLSGSPREALSVAREAEEYCRVLAEEDFTNYGQLLCHTLSSKSNIPGGLKREERANTWREIVSLRRRQAEEDSSPDKKHTLSGALITLGQQLESIGDIQGSLAVTEEAVAIRRERAVEEHGIRWKELASAIRILADRHMKNRSVHPALNAAAEGTSIYERLAAADFRRYGADLLSAHLQSAHLHSKAKAKAGAKRAVVKAVAIARRIDQQDSDNRVSGAGSSISKALAGAGLVLAVGEMYEDALPMLAEAVQVRREESIAGSPDGRAAELLRALGYYADALAVTRRSEEALPHADEAFAMSAKALSEFPEDRSLSGRRKTDTEQFYGSLIRLHGLLMRLRRPSDAHRIRAEGLELLGRLAKDGNRTARRLRSRPLPRYSPRAALHNPSKRH